jgi:methanogenic corrinoid protein MtbC1
MGVAQHHAYGLRQRSMRMRNSRAVRSAPLEETPGSHQKVLSRVIENTVVPRLVAQHARPTDLSLEAEVATFTDALMAGDASSARDHFDALSRRGHPLDLLFENLLAPAAARLGLMWDRDAIDFLDVAHAVNHIQQIILDAARTFCTDSTTGMSERNVLLVTLPEEHHRLGLCVLRSHFWREGWTVDCRELNSARELQTLVSERPYDALCVSAARVPDAAALAHEFKIVRRASCRSGLVIMAGGHAFNADPSLPVTVGVDATATSARECIAVLRRFFDRKAAQAC